MPDQYQNVIACPLLRGEELTGVLTLYSLSAGQYTLDHLRLLETVSATVSDAVSNALEHTQPADNSTTDLLTGLPNARLLEIIFSKEVHRAERYGYPLMLGRIGQLRHPAGRADAMTDALDRLLRELATLLSAEFRAGDTLARFAGDQFVVLLHRLTPDLIDDLMARISRTLQGWRFAVDSAQRISISLTMSYAIYGADGRTMPDLMQAADEQRREAKAARLNVAGSPASNLRFFPGIRREAAGQGG